MSVSGVSPKISMGSGLSADPLLVVAAIGGLLALMTAAACCIVAPYLSYWQLERSSIRQADSLLTREQDSISSTSEVSADEIMSVSSGLLDF